MKPFCLQVWREEQGVLTFEWILLLTILVIGILGGTAAVRDAVSTELFDVAGAATAVDLSYKVEASPKHGLGSTFQYKDQKKDKISPKRQNGTTPQPAVVVGQ